MVKREINGLISAPELPLAVPEAAQWLAGQGAGSWFDISKNKIHDLYNISRFTPSGEIEFVGDFKIKDAKEFSINCPYVFTYLSHYKSCNILQHGVIITFIRIS